MSNNHYYGPSAGSRSSSSRAPRPPAADGRNYNSKRGYRTASTERGYPRADDDDSNNYARYYRGRDDERRREGRDYSYDYSNPAAAASAEWECLECSSWNYGPDLDCTRCGAPQQTRSRQDEEQRGQRRRGGGSTDSHNEEQQQPEKKKSFAEELDEFGRLAAKAIPSKKTKVAEEKKMIWPPCFDKNGSAFVFDTRSGMFYESGTDFFYDPVSKLYYGNKQGAYYRYDEDKKVFEEVQKVDTAKAEEALAPTPVMDIAAKPCEAQEKKAAISIKLKTKSLASAKVHKKSTKTKVKASSAITDPAPRAAKKHAADLAKWTERQVEKRQEHEKDSPAQDTKKIATTAKGEPICLLCRRKFASLAKLEYHEKASNLHKENLAKLKSKEEPKMPPSSQQNPPGYVDRAQQRRTLYGPESSRIAAPLDVKSVVSLGSQSTAPLQQDNLGESNIGNQMLQKLGWKDGASLGRKYNNETSDGAPSQQPAAASVKQDWERIESMASSGGKVSRSSGGVGSHRRHGS